MCHSLRGGAAPGKPSFYLHLSMQPWSLRSHPPRHSLRRVDKICVFLSGAALQPPASSALSVGLGLLLHSCAAVAMLSRRILRAIRWPRAAKDVRDAGPQQRFWPASMVLTTALPARPVRRLELSEHSWISHADVCRSLKPCLQAILYLGSIGLA